jgi:hypothetical protein
MLMKRKEVLRRYRNLRAICTRHHTAAVKFLAQIAIMESARRLGLTAGHVLIADSTEELTLVFDLAIYTAREGRTRAIDRYAKAAQLPAGSHEMQMLEAMCRARFSIWRIERRHDTCGLVVTDQFRQTETWLVDEGLAATARDGMCFASRLVRGGSICHHQRRHGAGPRPDDRRGPDRHLGLLPRRPTACGRRATLCSRHLSRRAR